MRQPLIAGRDFSAHDHAQAERVSIITQRLARDLWPGQTAIGRRVKLGSADTLPWLTVVGVGGDVSANRGQVMNLAYVPFAQLPGDRAEMLIRADHEPLALARAIRSEIALVDPDLPLIGLQTVDQARRSNYWSYQVFATSLTVLATFAILLAAIGLYGVIAYNAAQRTREIGVRIALGAESRQILTMITAQGARLAVVGIVLGLAGAAVLIRLLRTMFFSASPLDLPVFAAVSLLLAVVAVAASYIPARRAARVDPIVALRSE